MENSLKAVKGLLTNDTVDNSYDRRLSSRSLSPTADNRVSRGIGQQQHSPDSRRVQFMDKKKENMI